MKRSVLVLSLAMVAACGKGDVNSNGECGPNVPCPAELVCDPVSMRCVTRGGLNQTDARPTPDATADAPRADAPAGDVVLSVHVGAGGSVAGTANLTCAGSDCQTTVAPGTKVTLTATATQGYRFSGWTGDGACAGAADNPLTLTVGAAMKCNAGFAPVFAVSATVTGASTPQVVATSTSAGAMCSAARCQVDSGGLVTLTAATAPDLRFVGWTGDPACGGGSTTLVVGPVTGNVSCIANYARRFVIAGAVAGASGEVKAASPDVTSTCSVGQCIADAGSQVTLTAPTIKGYRLVGWTGQGCVGSGAVVTVDPVSASLTCTASYVEGIAVVGSVAGAAGTVEVTSDSPGAKCDKGICIIDSGRNATLVAPTIADYRFTSWSGDAGCTGSGTTLALTNVTSSVTCVASYVKRVAVSVSIEGVPSAPAGAITLQPADPLASCTATACTVDAFSKVTLIAPALAGWRFTGWDGDCSGIEKTSLSPSADAVCAAHYIRQQTVSFGASPALAGSVSVAGGGCAATGCAVDYGSKLTFAYTSNAGYRFDKWTGDCTAGADNTAAATATANVTCTATFVQLFTVTFGASPPEGGGVTVSGGGCAASGCSVDSGSKLTFSYTKNDGYRFDKWSGDCIADAGNTALATASAAVTCSAIFVAQVKVTYGASPPAAGSVDVAGGGCGASGCLVDKGTPLVFSYKVNGGYRFDKWSGDCVADTGNTAVAKADADTTCTANYVQQFTVTYGASPPAAGGVTASGGGCGASGCAVDKGTKMTFSYTKNDGYRFDKWTGDCVADVNNPAMASATANAAITCTATFVQQFTVTFAANPPAGGSVSVTIGNCAASGCIVDKGTALTFSYTKTDGYRFDKWTGDCVAGAGTTATATANANVSCTANFVQQFTISASSSPAGAGSVSITGSGCGGGSSCTVDAGATVTVAEGENANFRFTRWSGCSSSAGTSISVMVNGTTSCTAGYYGLWAVSHGLASLDYGFAVVPLEDDSIAFDGVTVGDTFDGLLMRLDDQTGDPVLPDMALRDERKATAYVRDALPLGDATHATLLLDQGTSAHAALVFLSKAQDVTLRRDYFPDPADFSTFTPWRMIRTADGGFLLVGTGNHVKLGVNMTYVAKLDAKAVWQWSTGFAAGNTDVRMATDGRGAIDLAGKGYVIASAVDRGAQFTPRWFTMATYLDPSGKPGWSNLYTFGKRNNTPYDITPGLNGEAIIVGGEEEDAGAPTSICGTIKCDAFVLPIDPATNGKPGFTRVMGNPGFNDYFWHVVTLGRNYAAVGTTQLDDKRAADVWFATLSEKGTPIDQTAFGGTGGELGTAVAEVPSGGFAVTGFTTSWGGVAEAWAVRLDNHGLLDKFNAQSNAGIDKTSYAPVAETWTPQIQGLVALPTKMSSPAAPISAAELKTNIQRQAP